MKLIAIIPAKKHSRRLPNKNFKFFFGKPIIQYPLYAIEQSEIFDATVISTDVDIEKIGGSVNCLEELIIYKRLEHLCSDTATVDEVCLDVLEKYTGYDYLCVLYPTAYAVTWQDLCKSFYFMMSTNIDNYFSIGMLNGEYTLDNGGFYWVKISKFIETKRLLMIDKATWSSYELPMVDINDIKDFAQAKRHGSTLERFKCVI